MKILSDVLRPRATGLEMEMSSRLLHQDRSLYLAYHLRADRAAQDRARHLKHSRRVQSVEALMG